MLKLCELVVRMSTSKPENMSSQLLHNSDVGRIKYLSLGKKVLYFPRSVNPGRSNFKHAILLKTVLHASKLI